LSLRVVGAGTGRTGTSSLKRALEHLLGGPCYHMRELLNHPDHLPFWHRAAFGVEPDWPSVLAGYSAGVDWPVSAFWPELSAAFPDALILLSRRPAGEWWESARRTIYAPGNREPGLMTELSDEVSRSRFPIHPIIHDRRASMALFDEWNQSVIEKAPAERLLVWEVGDGWPPICDALGLPVPDLPFPHENRRDEFMKDWGEE